MGWSEQPQTHRQDAGDLPVPRSRGNSGQVGLDLVLRVLGPVYRVERWHSAGWCGGKPRIEVDECEVPRSNPGTPGGSGGLINTTPLPLQNEPVPREPSIPQITDGASNTIMAVEARRDIPWTKPEDIPFDPKGSLPELGGYWENGFNALFADGSVRALKSSIQPRILKALITRDGGEILSSDSY